MRILSQGQESKKTISAFVELTKFGDNVQSAFYDHFVRNFSISHAAMLNDLKPNNLSVAVKELNKVAAIVETLIEERIYMSNHIQTKEIK